MALQKGRLRGQTDGLFKTISLQVTVLHALIIREIYSRFGRKNIGFLWVIVEPALFTIGVIGLWSLAKNSSHTETPIVPFLLTGYMPLIIYRHVVGYSIKCMQNNQSLLYHRRVSVLSMYLARQLVEVLGVVSSFVICMFYFGIFGLVEYPYDLGTMIAGWLLYIWYCMSLGMVIGGLSERYEIVEKIWGPMSYLTIPATGAFFMLYWLPYEAQVILTYFPQVSAIEMLRSGYFGPGIPATYFITYTVAWCSGLTILGLFLLRDARRYLEVH